MCMICASIPAAAAVGVKLNSAQLNKPHQDRKPIMKITGVVITLLIAASVMYHTFRWQD